MKALKIIIIAVGIIVVGIAAVGHMRSNNRPDNIDISQGLRDVDTNVPAEVINQEKVDQQANNNRADLEQINNQETENTEIDIENTITFIGNLEKVDNSCFADGECYVRVNGNHVTAIMGFQPGPVGSVQGVEDFGDLENYIGQDVEVYALQTSENRYTLYGNNEYYIRVL